MPLSTLEDEWDEAGFVRIHRSLVMIVVSLATPQRMAPGVIRTMVRLHTPEQLEVDRGRWHPERT